MKNIKSQLDSYVEKYETPAFIPNDPISIPHAFTKKEDIEIAGLFAATLAWGNRQAIIKSCKKLITLMNNSPYDFIMNSSEKQLSTLSEFYHRTFNGIDTLAFAKSLKAIYANGGMEQLFEAQSPDESLIDRIDRFRNAMIKNMPQRTFKHVANIKKGSAGKRLNLFLRWMVRPSAKGVDFGLWHTVSPHELYLPLDVHSARISRQIGILERKQNDFKAVDEVTNILKTYCPEDPAKYDFALFAVDV